MKSTSNKRGEFLFHGNALTAFARHTIQLKNKIKSSIFVKSQKKHVTTTKYSYALIFKVEKTKKAIRERNKPQSEALRKLLREIHYKRQLRCVSSELII